MNKCGSIWCFIRTDGSAVPRTWRRAVPNKSGDSGGRCHHCARASLLSGDMTLHGAADGRTHPGCKSPRNLCGFRYLPPKAAGTSNLGRQWRDGQRSWVWMRPPRARYNSAPCDASKQGRQTAETGFSHSMPDHAPAPCKTPQYRRHADKCTDARRPSSNSAALPIKRPPACPIR
jgi:hypothetical protein